MRAETIVVSGQTGVRTVAAFIDGASATAGGASLPAECQNVRWFEIVEVGLYCVRDPVREVSFDDIRVTTP